MPHPIDPATGRQRRGFACMSPERRREIAASGGAAQPADKRSYARDRALAVSAGSKGGQASPRAKARRLKLEG